MTTTHSEIQTDRQRFVLAPLAQLEAEARRLRVELAGDRAAQLVVSLDLLIRRSAYRFIGGWRRIVDKVAAALLPRLLLGNDLGRQHAQRCPSRTGAVSAQPKRQR